MVGILSTFPFGGLGPIWPIFRCKLAVSFRECIIFGTPPWDLQTIVAWRCWLESLDLSKATKTGRKNRSPEIFHAMLEKLSMLENRFKKNDRS